MVLKKTIRDASGDVTLYYREALERDMWSLQEASLIVTGYVTAPILDSLEDTFTSHPGYHAAACIMRHALESCLAGKLKNCELGGNVYVEPEKFLAWAARKGWEFPETLSEMMQEKGFVFPKKKMINKNTVADHKQQVQEVGKKIAAKLRCFNQTWIYNDSAMQALLKNFTDPYGGERKPYTEGTVKRWLSEVDDRPHDKRRGFPGKKTKR